MGMLECLRAPKTALGVPAAGDWPPSERGVSLSSRRRNCWLFMVGDDDARMLRVAVARKKSRQAPAVSDSRAARMRGGGSTRNDVNQAQLLQVVGTMRPCWLPFVVRIMPPLR
jgi:hypothetical protein